MACFNVLFSLSRMYRAVAWTPCAFGEASTVLSTFFCSGTQCLTQLLRKYLSK